MSTLNAIPFRSTIFYNPNGSVVSNGYVHTVGSNGIVSWTNALSLNTISYSTLTGSTITASSITLSTITASGGVGINTTSPAYPFDVASGSIGIGNRLLGSCPNGDFFWTGLRGTATESYRVGMGIKGDSVTGGVSTIAFNVNSGNVMTLTSTLQVGIGTASPSYLLDVYGIARFNAGIGTSNIGGIVIGTSTDYAGNRFISALNSNQPTNSISYLAFGQNNSSKNQGEIAFYYSTSSSNANYIGLGLYGAASYLQVCGDGTINFTGYTSGGSLSVVGTNGKVTASSDRRIKNNIVYLTDTQTGLNQINQLQPVTFTFIGSNDVHLGFIAQDVEQYIPLAVDGKKHEYQWVIDPTTGSPVLDQNGNLIDRVDENGQKVIRPRGLSDRAIIATQTLAIQELSKQVSTLQSCIGQLTTWAQSQGFSQ
jgi:Chaperone of endosialidase